MSIQSAKQTLAQMEDPVQFMEDNVSTVLAMILDTGLEDLGGSIEESLPDDVDPQDVLDELEEAGGNDNVINETTTDGSYKTIATIDVPKNSNHQVIVRALSRHDHPSRDGFGNFYFVGNLIREDGNVSQHGMRWLMCYRYRYSSYMRLLNDGDKVHLQVKGSSGKEFKWVVDYKIINNK